MNFDTLFFSLTLSLLAGASTGIGGFISFFVKDFKEKHLVLALGFSAGVMIYISFTELLGLAIVEVGFNFANLAFFAGFVLFALLDFLIPHNYLAEKANFTGKKKRLFSATLLTTIGVALHNFPEGLVVLAASFRGKALALPLGLAIAIHNIPEGVAIAMPLYYLTKNKAKSAWLSLFSGLTEPLGVLVGWFLLSPFLNSQLLYLILAFTGGIMVFISFDELLPLCYRAGDNSRRAIIGIALGFAVMAFSLFLF